MKDLPAGCSAQALVIFAAPDFCLLVEGAAGRDNCRE
jgi:hypothetical protein